MKCATPAHVKNASTKQLLELWELTERMARSPELPVVRGWLMDELEARAPRGSTGGWTARTRTPPRRTSSSPEPKRPPGRPQEPPHLR